MRTIRIWLLSVVGIVLMPSIAAQTQKIAVTRLKQHSENMLVRISEIEVYPQYLQEYLTFAEQVGAVSVAEESGVVAIFPMIQKRDSCQIRILEIYADSAAYRTHIATDHFQRYKQGTMHMVKSLDLVDMYPMNADNMPNIFIKMAATKQ